VAAASLRGTAWTGGDTPEPVATPDAVALPFASEARSLRAPAYQPPPIGASVLRDVRFVARYHVVSAANGSVVVESVSTELDPGQFAARFLRAPVTTVLREPASTFRSVRNGFYHTLVDNVPRLYALQHAERALGTGFALLCADEPSAVEQFYLQRLMPPRSRIIVLGADAVATADLFVLPGFLSRRFSAALPAEYRAWFLERVAPRQPRRRDRRLVIGRVATSKGEQRCLLNEDDLMAALAPLGFERVVLESLPIAEQIALFHDAELVVGAHGAGLANLLFAERAGVVECFPAAVMYPHYYFLCRAMDHDYRPVMGSAVTRNDNFAVDVAAVCSHVRELAARPR
jgi:capsular polysaccharide biosynthesis protein